MTLFYQYHALNLDLMRPGRPQPSKQRVDQPAMISRVPRRTSSDEPHNPQPIFARTRPKTLDQDLLFARLLQVGSRRERLVKPQSEY
jgi:hypothetical protein